MRVANGAEVSQFPTARLLSQRAQKIMLLGFGVNGFADHVRIHVSSRLPSSPCGPRRGLSWTIDVLKHAALFAQVSPNTCDFLRDVPGRFGTVERVSQSRHSAVVTVGICSPRRESFGCVPAGTDSVPVFGVTAGCDCRRCEYGDNSHNPTLD